MKQKPITVDEIEMYFETFGEPSEDIEIIQGQFILCENAHTFIDNTISILRENTGNRKYMPDYERLVSYYLKAKELNS